MAPLMALLPAAREHRPGSALRLLLSLAALRPASGWRTWGYLPTSDHFAEYLGKFCFDYLKGGEAGRFEFKLQGHVVSAEPNRSGGPGGMRPEGKLQFLVYSDEEDHWPMVANRWGSLTCEETSTFASFRHNFTSLEGSFERPVFVEESVRPRFWYFTFVACGVKVQGPLYYEIHAENIVQRFQSEFSMDQRGSLQLQLLALALFVALFMGLRHVARRATGAEALRSRPLLRVLFLSTLCSALGAACNSLHFTAYLFNGYGLRLVEVFGMALVCGSKVLLTLLQLLTAKGWALFYVPQELAERRLIVLVLGLIIVVSVGCEIHTEYARDFSTDLYLYESWPGVVILALNVVLFAYVWRSMRETYRHETSEEVRIFYVAISSASLMYFLTLPTMCLLATSFSPWVRAKYVARAEVATRFLATLLLALCLRPSRLDAMVNARLEEGLETVGEPRDDEEDVDGDNEEDEQRKSSKLSADDDNNDEEGMAVPMLRKEQAYQGPAE